MRPLFFTPGGEPVSRYTLHTSFKKACNDAGHPERLFHDFRRTAARNSTRAGIPRWVAKRLSGHLTDGVFERYDIVDQGDLLDAGTKLEKRQRKTKKAERPLEARSAKSLCRADAGGGTRTLKGLLPPDFESGASASSATPAPIVRVQPTVDLRRRNRVSSATSPIGQPNPFRPQRLADWRLVC